MSEFPRELTEQEKKWLLAMLNLDDEVVEIISYDNMLIEKKEQFIQQITNLKVVSKCKCGDCYTVMFAEHDNKPWLAVVNGWLKKPVDSNDYIAVHYKEGSLRLTELEIC